jgi:hypothetical protein
MNWREATGYFRQVYDLYRYSREHPRRQTYRRASPDVVRR